MLSVRAGKSSLGQICEKITVEFCQFQYWVENSIIPEVMDHDWLESFIWAFAVDINSSMENMADISEPKVSPNELKDQ